MPASVFLRRLGSNLRTSFFVMIVAVILVFGWALVRGSDADWNILIFIGIGMFASSFVNALYDSRRGRS